MQYVAIGGTASPECGTIATDSEDRTGRMRATRTTVEERGR